MKDRNFRTPVATVWFNSETREIFVFESAAEAMIAMMIGLIFQKSWSFVGTL
jgi:hypothetical protein